MKRLAVLAIVLAFGNIGCTNDVPEQNTEQTLPPELTAERARTAMIELIRSAEPGELKDFPLERFVNDSAEGGKGNNASWGPFSFDLKGKEYTYSRSFGEPPRVCRWEFRGKFELKGAQWIALPPRVESQALGME